jgi:phospholipid/cholesterol/gamma-HCH transport system ATP-binding protein
MTVTADAPGDNVIEIRGLRTQFGTLVIHENLNLDIRRGEVVALVGGSGSGKTTLVRAMIMLLRPSAGSIKLFDQSVVDIDADAAFRLRNRFGVLFQRGALFSALTVRENVALPLHEHTRLTDTMIDAVAGFKIALVGLPAHAIDKYPNQLSGGMLKRAALARALALDPDLLFLDEPTAGLDPVGAGALDELVLQLRESLGLTVVMVTHDLDSLWRVTDRVVFLGEQRVIGHGSMVQLMKSEHPLIRQYFHGPRGHAAQKSARSAQPFSTNG